MRAVLKAQINKTAKNYYKKTATMHVVLRR